MKLTPEELAELPERLRDALTSGPVTLEEPVKEWHPAKDGWCVATDGTVSQRGGHLGRKREGNTRATKQQAIRLSKDRRGYCRLHAYRDQHQPDYVDPPIPAFTFSVVIDKRGEPIVFSSTCRSLSAIRMPKWLCEQLVADIKSGRYKL